MDRTRSLRPGPVVSPTRVTSGTRTHDSADARLRMAMLFAPALLAAGLAAALTLAARPAHAQTAVYIVHVVDQQGRELAGSRVYEDAGWMETLTPGTMELGPGPQVLVIEPAFQGDMLGGSSWLPTGSNALARTETVNVTPGGGDIFLEWRTADLTPRVNDQNGNAMVGAGWALAGEGNFASGGTLIAPLTDEAVYPSMSGPGRNGFTFAVRAGFDGQPVDLNRTERREVAAGTGALPFEWRQTSCTMGVVNASGTPVPGATWTILGHTFQAGDAISLPTTDNALYPGLTGDMAGGFEATLFTNQPQGTGTGTFEVNADGSLSPAFIMIGAQGFGLRCGVSPPPPPLVTGSIEGSVRADGMAVWGASLTVLDANNHTTTLTTNPLGFFSLGDVPQGPCTVTLSVPMEHHAVDPANGSRALSIVGGSTVATSFTIARNQDVANNPQSLLYWRNEVRAALCRRGAHKESFRDMSVNFPRAIFDQFANRPGNPIRVPWVTYVDWDGRHRRPPQPVTLFIMDAVLSARDNHLRVRVLRRDLLVILLNVVSGKQSLDAVIAKDGTTVSQRIDELAAAIDTYRTREDDLAAYQTEENGSLPKRLEVDRAAFLAGTSVLFTLTMSEDSHATLDLFDVAGRHITRIYEGNAPAGISEVTWQGRGVRAGVYFARLVDNEGSETAKLVVLQ